MNNIIFCSSAKHLKPSLSIELKSQTIETSLRFFTGGEVAICLLPEGRGLDTQDVYIVQSFGLHDVNNSLIELLFTIEAAKNSGAKKIHVIIPYMAYSRQDRRLDANSSFGLKVIASFLNNSGIASLTTIDLHSSSSIDLFAMLVVNIPGMDLVEAANVSKDKIIVSPDLGGFKRSAFKATVHFTKERKGGLLSLALQGDVNGKDCLIIDDIIDTGRTICLAAEMLMQNGARSVECFTTHALFSEETCRLVNESPLSRIIVSNSIANTHLPKLVEIVEISQVISSVIGSHH
ncbi:MAG: ribose-phosphate diphosphokinase [Pseudomonadota bacterium]